MSEQPLDLRRSAHILRRHWIAVSMVALLGLLGGVGYSELKPPMFASNALVVLPPNSNNIPTDVVIADSDHVLAKALASVAPAESLQSIRNRTQVDRVAQSNIVSITAVGKTAAQAEDTANAIANSFIEYISTSKGAAGKAQAQLLQAATTTTGTPLAIRLLKSGGLGALLGALIGAIGVLALRRSDRRLRQRDEIADAIGVPVLASLPVRHPASPGDWATLLEEYTASAVHAWRLRTALDYLGLGDARAARLSDRHGYSLTVLSLSSDRRALALGPQLAVVAASHGIPTALVIGPQQDTNTTASLHAACAAAPRSAKRSSQLQVIVADHDNLNGQAQGSLTVVVTVVDAGNPQLAGAMRTGATVLGVTAGVATAEQLARVAASASADGRKLRGIFVGDPDPSDRTTGRLPQLTRSASRPRPTRLTGITTEIRP